MSPILNKFLSLDVLALFLSFISLLHNGALALDTTTSVGLSVGNLTDFHALLAFKSHNREALSSWNESLHFCEWEGVQCSRRHQRVTALELGSRGLMGSLSPHIGNLSFLRVLSLFNNTLSDEIPSELGNLFRLQSLNLDNNTFEGIIPASLSRCFNLIKLLVSRNSLVGEFPKQLTSMPKLKLLAIHTNNLTGGISTSIGNLTSLQVFFASDNPFGGSIPNTLGQLKNLSVLYLGGTQISGTIPPSIYNFSLLTLFSASHNKLQGFEQEPYDMQRTSLRYFNINFNRLQGSVPLPPPSILIYAVAGNLLTGEIPPSFCTSRALFHLDLSDNNLSGAIPQCLTTSSNDSMSLLNLSSNNFHGTIPQIFMSRIQIIDLSKNQFHGGVPRSLANCTMLEILVLGDNQIEDTFPFWLGALPELQVLVLQSNKFNGAIENPPTNLKFPKLQIIDLSHNGFFGKLPPECFQNWHAMKRGRKGNSTYMLVELRNDGPCLLPWYPLSSTFVMKGAERFYKMIQRDLVVVDLSDNRFSGEIPESLGGLTGLKSLNISNNNLSGSIPSSLANLTDLESLDLSQNQLSGDIPPQLTQLTFLSVINVSHNRLTGPIPRGKQFDTFDNTSYGGNMGLCGVPLMILCGNSETSPPSAPAHNSHGDDSGFSRGIYWMVICMGCGSGMIVGLVIGHTLTTRYHEWFVATFERGKKTQKRQRN